MEQENKPFDINRYVELLLRRKWLVIIPTIIFGIGAILYASRLPDIYESKCILTVKRSRVIDNVLAGGAGREDVRKALQAVREKMLGWASVTKVIKATGLDKDIPEDDQLSLEKLYRSMLGKISLKARGDDLIEVGYQGEDPETNFRIVDNLVSNFLEESLKSARNEADETLSFIEGDLVRLRKKMDESERRFRGFEEEHMEELPGNENSILPKLYNAKGDLLEVNRKISDLQERVSFLGDRKKGESATITGETVQIPNPTLKDLNQQIINIKINITMLRAKYFDEHPVIMQRQKELKRLNEMLENEAEKVVSEETIINNPRYERMIDKEFDMHMELKILGSRKKELEGMIIAFKPSIENIPALKQKLFELESGFRINRALYEERLMQKSKAELVREISLDSKSSSFNIVEPARISYKPLKNKKRKIMAMGFFLGAGLGIGLILGLDKIDQRFKTEEEVQEYLKIPVLGMVPTIIIKTDNKN
ncbi:MAG: Wzz/FepE/Etk N-terminal domain-containing protein [Candidatus Anammoxibacter sp.]